LGHAPRRVAALAAYVGPPLDETFRALTGVSDRQEIARFVALYRERYAAVGYAENTLYAGIDAVLARLHDAGVAMAVCTSKRVDFARRILDHFGLSNFFRFVDGGEIGVTKTQQVAALRAKGLVEPATVMVGDRATDLVAAHCNGLQAGAALWGFGSETELRREHPRYIFAAPAELLAFEASA
jgi:phosphoglycolate phosphatase